jgi:hypothetical protein
MKKFEVTKEHIKLLKEMYVSWWDCEFGAPAIDPKRPYGNRDVLRDLAETVYGAKNLRYSRDGELPESIEIKLCDIHTEMKTVLQILVNNCRISPGMYWTKDDSERVWVREK